MTLQTKYRSYLSAADVKNNDDDDDDSSGKSIRHDLAKFLISILCKKKGKDSLKTLMAEKGSAFKHFGIHELSELKDFCSAHPQCFTVHAPTPTGHSHVEDSEVEVVAAVQICPMHVKTAGSCPEDGECGCLHVCKFYMLSGKCEYSTKRKIVCHFGHNMHSDHNDVILKRHLIDHLDVAELRNLLQQRKARTRQTRPMYCRFYNMPGGCGRGEKCTALHVCRRFALGVCKFGEECRRNHDLNEPGVKAILEQYAVKPEELLDLMADNQQEISMQAPIPTSAAVSLPIHPPLSTQSTRAGLNPQLSTHYSFPGQSGFVVQAGQTFWGSCAAGSSTGEDYWGMCLSDASQGGYWGPCPEDAAFAVSGEETESDLLQNTESVTKSTNLTLPPTLFSQQKGHLAACQEEAGPPEAREEAEMDDGNKTDEVSFLSLDLFQCMNVHDADRHEIPENCRLSKNQEITRVSGVGTMPSHTAAIRPSSDLSAAAVGSRSSEDIVSEKTRDSSFIPLKTNEKNAAGNITCRPVASVPPQVKVKPKLGSCAPGGIPKPSQEVLFGCSKTADPEKHFPVDGQGKKRSDNVDNENSSAAELAAGSSNPEGITGENVSPADVPTNQPANDLKSIIADLISNVKKLHSVNTGPEVPIMSFLSNLADPGKPRDVLPAAKETVGAQQEECQTRTGTQYLSEGEIPESDQEVEARTSDKTAESEPQKLLFDYNHQPACEMIGNMVKETRNPTEAQLSHDSPSCLQQQLQKDPVTLQELGAVLESHQKRHGRHLRQRKSRKRFSADSKTEVQYDAACISDDHLELIDSSEDRISDILSLEETLEPIESSMAESKQTEKERDGSYIHCAKDDTEHKGLAEHHIMGKESDRCVQDGQTIQTGDDHIQESNSSRNVKTDRPVSESDRGKERTLHEILSAMSSVPKVSALDHKVNQSQISPSRKLSSTRSTSPKSSRSSSNQRESSADQRKYSSVTNNSAGEKTVLEPRHSAPRLSDSGMSSRYERPLLEGKPQKLERRRVHRSSSDRSSTGVYDCHSMERPCFISKRNWSDFDHHSDRSNMAREDPKLSRYSSKHHSDGPQRLSSRGGRHPDHRRDSPDHKGMSLCSGARRSSSNDRRSWNNERKTHQSSARSSSSQQSTSNDWRTGSHRGRYSPVRRNELCDGNKSPAFSRQWSPNRRGKPEAGHSAAFYRESRCEHSSHRDRHRLERRSAEYSENTRDWRDERRRKLRDESCDARFRDRSPEHGHEMYRHITRGHSPCQDTHRSRFSTERDQVRSTNRDRERSWDGLREKDSVVNRDCNVNMEEGMRSWGRDRWTEGYSEGRHSGCREKSVQNNVMDRLGPSPVRFKQRLEQGRSFMEEEGLGFEEAQQFPLAGGLDQDWPNDKDMEGTRDQRCNRRGYRGKHLFVGKISNRFASYDREKRAAGNTAESKEDDLDNSFSEPEVTLKYSSQSDEDDGNERLLAPDYRRRQSRQDRADGDQLMMEDYGSGQHGSMFSFGKRGRDSQDGHRKLEAEDQHRATKRHRGYDSSFFSHKGLLLDSHGLPERSPRRQENESFQELSMLHAEDGGREGHREYRHRLGETGDCSPSAYGSGGLSEHIDLFLCDARHSSSGGRDFLAPSIDSDPFHSQHEADRDADLGNDFHQKFGDNHFKQNLHRGFPRKRRAVHEGCNKRDNTKRQQISPDKDQGVMQYHQTLPGQRGNAQARLGNVRSRLGNARRRNRKTRVGCLTSSRSLSPDRQDRPGKPPQRPQSREPLEGRHSPLFPESYEDIHSQSPSAQKMDTRPSNRTDGLSTAGRSKWRSESRMKMLLNDDASFEDGLAPLDGDYLDEKQLSPYEESDRDFEIFCSENNFTEVENNDEEFNPELFSYDDDDADVMQVPRPQVRSRDLRHVLRKRRRSGPLLQAEMEPIQIRLRRQNTRESDL